MTNPKPLVRLIDPDKETWLPLGKEFQTDVEAALNPVIDKYMDQDVSSLDMELILMSYISYHVVFKRVMRQLDHIPQHQQQDTPSS